MAHKNQPGNLSLSSLAVAEEMGLKTARLGGGNPAPFSPIGDAVADEPTSKEPPVANANGLAGKKQVHS